MRIQLPRIKPLRSAFFLFAIGLAASLASAQTSVAGSLYGAFTGTTSGSNRTSESPSNSAGGMFELRRVSNPILGFEATYSFNRADEKFTAAPPACPVGIVPCGPEVQTVRANAHEITADWNPSLHIANLRPFGVLGVGLLLNVPDGAQSNTSTKTEPVYIYGAGLDWGLLPHLGLRFQYRGNLYKAPDLTTLYTSIDAFTHTAEPMIGVYFNL